MPRSTYAIALGSNRRTRHGAPEATLAAAIAMLEPVAVSAIVPSRPVGPSARRFANAVAILESPLDPPALLASLKRLERDFGRRAGRRWGPRALDLDIVLWSGGIWAAPDLAIPHPAFRTRSFVLEPLAALAPAWRDPATGLTVRQLAARLTRRKPLPR